jgi:hypothetical protein
MPSSNNEKVIRKYHVWIDNKGNEEVVSSFWPFSQISFGRRKEEKQVIASGKDLRKFTDEEFSLPDSLPSGSITGNDGGVIGVSASAALHIGATALFFGISGIWAGALITAACYFGFLILSSLFFHLLDYSEWVRKKGREPKVVAVLYGVSGAIIGATLAPLLGFFMTPLIALIFALSAGAWARIRHGNDIPIVNNQKQLLKNISAPSGITGASLGLCLGFIIAALLSISFISNPLLFTLILLGCSSFGFVTGATIGFQFSKPTLWGNTRGLTGKQRISSIIYGLAAVRLWMDIAAPFLSLIGVTGTLAVATVTLIGGGAIFLAGYFIGHKIASTAFNKNYENGDARLLTAILSVGTGVVLAETSKVLSTLILASAFSAFAILPYLIVPAVLCLLTFGICKLIKYKDKKQIDSALNCGKIKDKRVEFKYVRENLSTKYRVKHLPTPKDRPRNSAESSPYVSPPSSPHHMREPHCGTPPLGSVAWCHDEAFHHPHYTQKEGLGTQLISPVERKESGTKSSMPHRGRR